MRLRHMVVAVAAVGILSGQAFAGVKKSRVKRVGVKKAGIRKSGVRVNFTSQKLALARRSKGLRFKKGKKIKGTGKRIHLGNFSAGNFRRLDNIRLSSLFGVSLAARSGGDLYSKGRYLGRTTVSFKTKYKPGTIYISTRERALYYILADGRANKYGVGVGREGFTWKGRHRVSMKKEWPEWRPPAEMIEREKAKYGRDLPEVMEGGPRNPLGARAIYIGSTLYRIHGTNNPSSIGKNVSSGCIRMLNSEVSELYDKVRLGSVVVVK